MKKKLRRIATTIAWMVLAIVSWSAVKKICRMEPADPPAAKSSGDILFDTWGLINNTEYTYLVQKHLVGDGYDIPIDGIPGPKTEAARIDHNKKLFNKLSTIDYQRRLNNPN